MDQSKAAAHIADRGGERKEIPFVKRTGVILGAVFAAVLTVGGIGVYAMVGGGDIPQGDIDAVTQTFATTANTSATSVSDSVVTEEMVSTEASVVWAKAGIEQYDLVVETAKATETTKTASVSETETETETTTMTTAAETKKTTTTTTAAAAAKAEKSDSSSDSSEAEDTSSDEDEIRSCSAKTRYATEKVNLRKEPSLDADVISVITKDTEVSVVGYNSEWYKIKLDGEVGYSMKKYFTSEAPEAEEEVEEDTTVSSVISYTSEEFDMLCYVLQGEVGSCSDSSKIAVANVIINRVKSSAFPNTISGVLTQANQFTAVYNYYNGTNKPTESTINCAKRALAGEDNTNGAIYYYAPKYCSSSAAAWFESLTLCLELEGQRFFK